MILCARKLVVVYNRRMNLRLVQIKRWVFMINPKLKKIGILTFHKSINYGSVLQAYALCMTLQGMGYYAELIDYEPKIYRTMYQNLYLKNDSFRHAVGNLMRRFPIRKAFYNRQREFERFRNIYLPLSREKYELNSDLEALNQKYDAIIVGSDQVWNVTAYDCDDVYFLPISHKAKKIAYAVSLNNATYTEERCNEEMRSWIIDFDAISCREKSGCARIARFIHGKKTVNNTLDPTLIANPKIFAFEGRPIVVEKPYIFLYSVNFSAEAVKVAKRLSMRTGMPVYSLMTGAQSYRYVHPNREHIHILKGHLAPEDFVNFIRHAEIVVTNSFHGTAFSINLEKNFYSVCEKYPDGTIKEDDRISGILSSLGIVDRMICAEDMNSIELGPRIDYSVVNQLKEAQITHSKQFLVNAIEG